MKIGEARRKNRPDVEIPKELPNLESTPPSGLGSLIPPADIGIPDWQKPDLKD